MDVKDQKISQQLQDKVNRELIQGERITWVEKPVPQFFTILSTSQFLFAIPWAAFSIFWILSTVGFKWPDIDKTPIPSLVFPLFGLPYLLIGISMLFNPVAEFMKASNTIYVITNKRAIAFDGKGLVKSYYPDQLSNLYRRDKRNGLGDILISKRVWRNSEGDEQSENTGFLNIRNPMRIERMLTELASVN